MNIKKIMAGGMIISMVILTACNSNKTSSNGEKETDAEYAEALNTAVTTPYGKYPDTVTYTLGKLSGKNNSNMPSGDTYENNAYTRFIKELLNVQNEDVFEVKDEQYDANVSMAISSGDIPDIMLVSNLEDVQLLVQYDMIADLTDSYENCMSDKIKSIYDSYDDSMMDSVTFDGKIMAIPETNIEDGPNLIWLRKDWMDKLGLEAPRTISDVENIVSQFIEKDPGENGAGNTVGLVCDSSICGECGYSNEYLLDTIFASYGAYPKQWIYDSDGNVAYGTVLPETKKALEHINQMYTKGILDNNFLLRTSSNIIELINNGQCGSFFGPWWAPNNPLMDAVELNRDAKWWPYLIETDNDGKTSFYSKNPAGKYVVVRKNFEHPEIVCKILSTLYDYIRYDEDNNDVFKLYYQQNVDPTARPLAINVDYNEALSMCYSEISKTLDGEKRPEELNLLESSYYEACRNYLNDSEKASPEEWAAYTSRVTACKLIAEGNLRQVKSLFFGETNTMASEWWKLKDMENQIFLKIVTGEVGIDEFDKFVADWKEQGGETITKEVENIENNK